MKPITHKLALALSLVSSLLLCQTADAVTTPADQDKLRMHTSMPRRTSDSLFSYTAEWRIDDGELYRSTGLSFLNAHKFDEAAPSAVTKKLLTSMKDGMIQLDPNWRGITITQPPEQAELTIANKNGYSLTTVTVRDYSNQGLRFDLADKSFSADGVQVALDLVFSADVEYLDGFSSKKALTASQGEIEIKIDDQKPIHIKTDGKTTRELEQEIAKQLSIAQLAETPLYPGMVSNDTRNNKPFDGSEVQFLNLAAKSIAIDINDPALGVLAKFKFKDENHSVKVVEPRFMLGALALTVILAIVYFRRKNAKKPS
ncbi:hypothetical protein [Methylomonas albis]|uniref:Uncharacterized protein n=1 Tax=Methylomonas albis TaxID=1854563 RepID=A0ABR9D3R1_9GAMM|nr:hypothetical protein [Methylomonas albis]MBD9357705.1 hypothetical protein [Methylomonas albis]CAD6881019.1 hypothetical protein [Methylomonas albis]